MPAAASSACDSNNGQSSSGDPRPGGRRVPYEQHRNVRRFSLRKEVIQPQVLLRLPCYDFTPIMSHTVGHLRWTSSTTHFRDVTGGVYKARERIHGVVLIRHY
jgi:hypothetical protein